MGVTQYFVYAINKKWQEIVAALSCPDEKTGRQAYLMACQQMGWDLEDSVCGVAHINDRTTIKVRDSDGHGTIRLHFRVGDFETAAKQTKERICEGKTGGKYDELMRSVGFALEELTGEIEPAMHSYSITEAANTAETGLFSKFEHGAEIIGHAIEGVIHGVFGNTIAHQLQTARGNGHPKSPAEGYDDSMPLRESTTEMIVKGIAFAACKDIAVAVEREKLMIELLSVPQTEKELEKIHVEILSEKGYKPLEIATMIYHGASGTTIRQKSQWISNHLNSLNKSGN